MSMSTTPWLLAFAGAVCFGFLAWRAGRNWISWGLTGGLFALVTTTFVFGLGSASCIPFSDRDWAAYQTTWALLSVGIIAVLGALFTVGLWRRRPEPVPVASNVPALPVAPKSDKPRS
jgi:hypothetical protein